MKPVVFVFCLVAIPTVARASAVATCAKGLEQPFDAGRDLKMKLRSGEIEIVGTPDARVKVLCEVSEGEDPARISIRFEPERNSLRVAGGSTNNDLKLRIEVPATTHLHVRAPAGELKIRNVTGNKDVGLHAGEMTIEIGDPREYAKAHAGVKVGEVNANAFGVNKGGFFRSFKTSNPGGRYTLHAGVGAGEITLN